MLAGEPKPIRRLLGREQLLLLGNRHRNPLALAEQSVDLVAHKRRLTASSWIKVQSLHRPPHDSTNLSYLLMPNLTTEEQPNKARSPRTVSRNSPKTLPARAFYEGV